MMPRDNRLPLLMTAFAVAIVLFSWARAPTDSFSPFPSALPANQISTTIHQLPHHGSFHKATSYTVSPSSVVSRVGSFENSGIMETAVLLKYAAMVAGGAGGLVAVGGDDGQINFRMEW